MHSPDISTPATRDASWLLIPLVLALSLTHLAAPGLLDFDRAGIAAGQWWRLATAHYVHLNTPHLAMNALALTLVVALLRTACRAATWFVIYGVVALATSVALLVFEPQLERYAGASGVIHGLVAYGAILRVPVARAESLVLLAGLAAKLAWEVWAGPLGGSEAMIGAPVITASHRFGAIAGAIAALVTAAWRSYRARFSAPAEL